MRNVSKLLLVFSLACLITACPAQEKPVVPGKLEVKISGLPSGTNANVTVTGPAGFTQVLTSTKTLTDLTAGKYEVTAANVTAGSSYGASVTGSPASITAGNTSSVSVAYGALRTITGKLVLNNGQPFIASNFGGAVLSVKLLGSTVDIPIDASGGFVVNNVPSTYSLVMLITSQSFRSAIVYQGLTRTNPTLTILGGSSVPVQSTFATVEGKFTGGLGFSATSKATTEFTVSVPKAVSSGSSNRGSVDPTTGNYTAFINWAGGNPIAATMHALQYSTNETNGKITAFGGYAQKTINLVPSQGTPIKQDITLAPVNSGTVNGSINWPSGITAPQYSVSTILFLSGLNTEEIFVFPPLGSQPSSGVPDGYDQLVPVIAGAKLIQRVGITEKPTSGALLPPKESGVWKTVTPGATTNIVVPAPIALTAPESAASGVTGNTKFTWSAFSGGVHLLSFFSGMSGVQTSIVVVTAASSSTFPDLSAYGFGLPKAATYVWWVNGIAPYASMDMATDTSGLNLPFGPFSIPTSDGSYSSSGFQPFTTAP
jgi:hypothetical protein